MTPRPGVNHERFVFDTDGQNKRPYMLVVGQRESDEGTVSIRLRDGRQLPAMKVADFAEYAKAKVESRDLEL